MYLENDSRRLLLGLILAGALIGAAFGGPIAARAEAAEGLWGVWQGYNGNEAIYLCIDSDPTRSPYDNFAAIYSTKDYKIELLDRSEDEPAKWLPKQNPQAIATLKTLEDGSVQLDRGQSDVWSGVVLSQLDHLDAPCESMTFNLPRAIMPPRLVSTPESVDGEFYDVLRLEDPNLHAEVTTFHLAADTPGRAAINAWLWDALPKDVESSEYFDCAKSSVASGYGYWSQRLWPEFLSYYFVVVGEHMEYYCGGAYPNDYTQWHVFDASTGAAVDTSGWIKPDAYGLLGPHANDGTEIDWPRTDVEIKFRELFERAYFATAPHGDCPNLPDVVEIWHIRPSRSGLAFSPEVGGMLAGCAEDLVIAYDYLEEFIPDDVKSKLP